MADSDNSRYRIFTPHLGYRFDSTMACAQGLAQAEDMIRIFARRNPGILFSWIIEGTGIRRSKPFGVPIMKHARIIPGRCNGFLTPPRGDWPEDICDRCGFHSSLHQAPENAGK